jgi:hypothetical protein
MALGKRVHEIWMILGNVAALSEPAMMGIVPQRSIVPNGPITDHDPTLLTAGPLGQGPRGTEISRDGEIRLRSSLD